MISYRYDTALFDLDGTLTDSAEGIINCIRYALEQTGREIPSDDIMRRFLGPPLVVSFEQLCGMSKEQAAEATRIFRVRYADIGLFENRPYDGVKEMLTRLKSAGIRIATATSKPEDYAVRILTKFGLIDYFDFIGAATFDESRHDKIAVLGYTLDKLGIKDKSRVIMVGDRSNDIDGAHHYGLKCIAVRYGYGNDEEFKAHSADFIADTPGDVADMILDTKQ
ncbi:MAG: HAD-IA family hydrolase [Ruminococcus sp.]|nr:HAD-IA family hydrolase [Ruminococcus sp.]